jgi:hypothetical protein
MKIPNKDDFVTILWIILVCAILFTCQKNYASDKESVKTFVECKGDYKFIAVKEKDKKIKYIYNVDFTLIFKYGEKIKCGQILPNDLVIHNNV